MAYTPTEWKSGDVITAEKLNNMEEGISESDSAPLILQTIQDNDTVRLDKTFGEIKSAFNSRKAIWLVEPVESGSLYTALQTVTIYDSTGGSLGFGGSVFDANLDEDYPTLL